MPADGSNTHGSLRNPGCSNGWYSDLRKRASGWLGLNKAL